MQAPENSWGGGVFLANNSSLAAATNFLHIHSWNGKCLSRGKLESCGPKENNLSAELSGVLLS